jgi:hypothetical protein
MNALVKQNGVVVTITPEPRGPAADNRSDDR